MIRSGSQPSVIFLDVDGVLAPDGRPTGAYREHVAELPSRPRPLYLWLNPGHGPMLLGLAAAVRADLVWCTTWNEQANLWIGPRIGLPRLPVCAVSGPATDTPGEEGAGGARKLDAIRVFAAGRHWVWFDDEVPDTLYSDRDELPRGMGRVQIREWPDDHGLGVRVNKEGGLSAKHVEYARAWLAAVTCPGPRGERSADAC